MHSKSSTQWVSRDYDSRRKANQVKDVSMGSRSYYSRYPFLSVGIGSLQTWSIWVGVPWLWWPTDGRWPMLYFGNESPTSQAASPGAPLMESFDYWLVLHSQHCHHLHRTLSYEMEKCKNTRPADTTSVIFNLNGLLWLVSQPLPNAVRKSVQLAGTLSVWRGSGA